MLFSSYGEWAGAGHGLRDPACIQEILEDGVDIAARQSGKFQPGDSIALLCSSGPLPDEPKSKNRAQGFPSFIPHHISIVTSPRSELFPPATQYKSGIKYVIRRKLTFSPSSASGERASQSGTIAPLRY